MTTGAGKGGASVVLTKIGPTRDPNITPRDKFLFMLLGDRGGGGDTSVFLARSHLHDRAVEVLDKAERLGWNSLRLVAPADRLPRAMLTFLQELRVRGRDKQIRVIPVALYAPWNQPALGQTKTRLELIYTECQKIDWYTDVASYDDGIEYLLYWESKDSHE